MFVFQREIIIQRADYATAGGCRRESPSRGRIDPLTLALCVGVVCQRADSASAGGCRQERRVGRGRIDPLTSEFAKAKIIGQDSNRPWLGVVAGRGSGEAESTL